MFHDIDNYIGGGEGRGRELVHIPAMKRKVHRVDSDQSASYQSAEFLILERWIVKCRSFFFTQNIRSIKQFSTPSTAIHNNCPLLSLLLMCYGSLYCIQYGLRSDCSLGSSLIRVHIVGFLNKISL